MFFYSLMALGIFTFFTYFFMFHKWFNMVHRDGYMLREAENNKLNKI